MADYSKMTQEDFEDTLQHLVQNMNAAEVLAVPGVREAMQEALNNDVLDTWAEEHPELAWPEEQEEDDSDDCPVCGGSGGGEGYYRCQACGGSGVSAAAVRARRQARDEARADSYDPSDHDGPEVAR